MYFVINLDYGIQGKNTTDVQRREHQPGIGRKVLCQWTFPWDSTWRERLNNSKYTNM